MKAIRLEQPGGPEQLVVNDYPTPEPRPGEVLVQVDAAGINFIDVYQRTGFYALPKPIALGQEGAGRVVALGANVSSLHVGDLVAWTGVAGSYATHVAVPVERAVPVPSGVELRTAAALMLQGLTAHYLSHATFALEEGHTALVHAAAGGVGLLLVQMAVRAGARVIATVSSEAKADVVRELGAHDVIIYTREDFLERTRTLTGQRGVDVVYDSVGKTTFDKSLQALAARGHLVLFGQSSGPVGPIDPLILAQGSLFLTRPTLGHYVATRAALERRADDLFAWVKSGALTVRVERTFALHEAAEAHRALESRATTGKLLLIP